MYPHFLKERIGTEVAGLGVDRSVHCKGKGGKSMMHGVAGPTTPETHTQDPRNFCHFGPSFTSFRSRRGRHWALVMSCTGRVLPSAIDSYIGFRVYFAAAIGSLRISIAKSSGFCIIV